VSTQRLACWLPLGRCDSYEVLVTPRDGSSRIKHWVRAAPPHYPLRTEYTRGDLVLISEVTRMIIADQPGPCSR
jgi:hypothetical protein